MITFGNELIRINPQKASRLEYSSNGGRSWSGRLAPNSTYGDFLDLTVNGNEILVQTSKGLFASTNGGVNFIRRR